MNKLNLTIDVEKINLESENHTRNFQKKIKNLAQHCVNFINNIVDKTDCANKKFFLEIHDDDTDSTIDSQYVIPNLEHQNKKINFDFFDVGDALIIHS